MSRLYRFVRLMVIIACMLLGMLIFSAIFRQILLTFVSFVALVISVVIVLVLNHIRLKSVGPKAEFERSYRKIKETDLEPDMDLFCTSCGAPMYISKKWRVSEYDGVSGKPKYHYKWYGCYNRLYRYGKPQEGCRSEKIEEKLNKRVLQIHGQRLRIIDDPDQESNYSNGRSKRLSK